MVPTLVGGNMLGYLQGSDISTKSDSKGETSSRVTCITLIAGPAHGGIQEEDGRRGRLEHGPKTGAKARNPGQGVREGCR